MAMMTPLERRGLLVGLELEPESELELVALEVGLEREFWVVPKRFREVELGNEAGSGEGKG